MTEEGVGLGFRAGPSASQVVRHVRLPLLALYLHLPQAPSSSCSGRRLCWPSCDRRETVAREEERYGHRPQLPRTKAKSSGPTTLSPLRSAGWPRFGP